jgi:calcineurin-like phosphoesterase family protein
MPETFVTSDQHWNHTNIIEFCGRPWWTVAAMNDAMIESWNATVAPDDIVWVLGDWALGKLAESLQITQQLNGHKRLLPGNHDRCHPMRKDYRPKHKSMYIEAGFEMVVDPPVLRGFKIGGHVVDMCHFPYEGDSLEHDRYVAARPEDQGRILLHGHVHTAWAEKPEQRMINVGVDVRGYRPMHSDEVAALCAAMG